MSAQMALHQGATTAAKTLTEAVVTGLLRERHENAGNGGGEWAFMAQVRNAAGFDASRTLDALAMHLWPSRGLVLHAFEIKVSRSDFLREIKDPAKAEDACRLVEFFWIVAPKGVVRQGELPPTWGLIEVLGDGTDEDPWRLRTKTAAPCLLDPGQKNRGSLRRGLVVSMLRSVPGAVPGGRLTSASDRQLREAEDRGYRKGLAEGEKLRDSALARARTHLGEWTEFQEALQSAGLARFEASALGLTSHAAAIASAVKGGKTHRDLRGVRDHLARTIEALDVVLAGDEAQP
jgi:hypothetical protein